MKYLISLIIFAILSFSACKTDFDINAEWKDITVVYGLLDQSDSIHYVKISKAFLGEGNAMMYAKNPDSSSYDNNLDVRIEEWNNGFVKSYVLDTVTISKKDSGDFYYPFQVVYFFKEKKLETSSTYKLVVKNKVTGKIVTSETPMVRSFSINKPFSTMSFHAPNSSYKIEWDAAKYGRLYQAVLRFNYWEKNIFTKDSVQKYSDWLLGTLTSEKIDGTGVMEVTYNGSSFYSYLGKVIPVNDNVRRTLAFPNLQLIISVAGDDLATYIQVNKPSSDIVLQKPEFTNISPSGDAIGLFSSRYNKVQPYTMSKFSIDSLASGQYTKKLNFYK